MGIFLKEFLLGLGLSFPLWATLALGITVLGQVVTLQEGWSRFDGFYWSFMTARKAGYGDIRQLKMPSKVLAVMIAFLRLTLSGVVIAVAVQAATLALGMHR